MSEALAVTGLVRRFGDREVVRGVSLALAAGEVHALVGPNGAGKSTVLRLIAGLLPCDAGEGRVLGIDLRRTPRKVAASVGYMAQRLALHAELSVEETLRFRAEAYGVAQAPARIAEILERFGLGGLRRVRTGSLSGGWARRLQLAATLIHAPRLLLLDEPTAGLDYAARRELWTTIDSLAAAGTAVLVNTHDPSEAERCGRVTVLADGRVRAFGAPAELIRHGGFAALLLEGPGAAVWLEATPWACRSERWGEHLRLLLPCGQAEAAATAARNAGLTVAWQAPRLEHAWPALFDAPADPE